MKICLRSLARVAPLALLVTLATTVGACAAPADEDDGAAVSQDELRSYVDAPRERPEVGRLDMGSTYCTATLIGTRTILTAAHCFEFSSGIVAASDPAPGRFIIDRADGTRIAYPYHRYRADASVLNVKFDLGIAQLDARVGPEIATPAVIAEEWPSGRLTVYGYGRYGSGCANTNSTYTKRKTTVPSSFPFVKATTCPGDSGGPYFIGTTNEIVATVKGDALGLEFTSDAVQHRDWILARLADSERGELTVE
jgi:hypothetical protein